MSFAVPAPSNVQLPPGTSLVESDLFDIATRIKTIDPNLFIVLVEQPNARHRWVVMERCKDGVDRKVMGTDELDGRVLDRLRYLLQVPLDKRLAEFEKQEALAEENRREEAAEKLYEDVGGPMKHLLYRCGFATNPTPALLRPKRDAAPIGVS